MAFGGEFFGTVYCRITGASGGFAPGPPSGLCPGLTEGLIAPPDNQPLQAMKYGHCISCFRQDTTFIHALTTCLAHHPKYLKKRPDANWKWCSTVVLNCIDLGLSQSCLQSLKKTILLLFMHTNSNMAQKWSLVMKKCISDKFFES